MFSLINKMFTREEVKAAVLEAADRAERNPERLYFSSIYFGPQEKKVCPLGLIAECLGLKRPEGEFSGPFLNEVAGILYNDPSKSQYTFYDSMDRLSPRDEDGSSWRHQPEKVPSALRQLATEI